jgi:F-type H+-transporting ATPase subunit epsilon
MASSEADLSDQVMAVKVFSPREVYYDGPAISLSAENDTGKFDILPLHHSFISLLKAGNVTIGLHDDKQKVLAIEKGLLRVKDNKVTVFLDV